MKKNLYYRLYDVSIRMKNGRFGKILYDFLSFLGLRKLINLLNGYKKATLRRKQPDEALKNTRRFFGENQGAVDEVVSFLADDLSKQVYRGMVRFRSSLKKEDLPKFDMEDDYFHYDFFDYQDGEVFVDCGAFDGDTIVAFKKMMKKKHKRIEHIVAFEPDSGNAQKIEREHTDVCVINRGVWDKDDVLHFDGHGNSGGKISEDGDICVPVCSIDGTKDCSRVTFLKMDIEGAEWEALHGAIETIKRNRPKLAICIYHLDEDMIRIPKLLHEMLPDYSFYVRQHSNYINDTVLYGTPLKG